MNANQWVVEPTGQDDYNLPYPMDECQRRLERLNEPATPQGFQGLVEAHTAVKPISQRGMSAVYQVQRINPARWGTGRPAYAALTLTLRSTAGSTHIHIASATQSSAQIGWYVVWLLRVGLILLFPLLYSPTRTIYLLQVGIILAVAMSWLGLIWLHRRQQRIILRKQIDGAFGLDTTF